MRSEGQNMQDDLKVQCLMFGFISNFYIGLRK